MIDVKVGDTVIISQHQREPYEATVVKVARVWITVDAGRPGWMAELRFRRDDQTDGAEIGYPAFIYTLDQWAEKQRNDEAIKFLREQGITVERHSSWRGREAELVNLLRNAGRG